MSTAVWSIGGFDPSNGAGILADNHIYSKLEVSSQTIMTAITAQNGKQVILCQPLSASAIEEQLKALISCGWPKVIKIGLLPNRQCIEMLLHYLRPYKGILVYDPVMISSSGQSLMDWDALNLLKDKWLQRISVLTPNINEAQVLSGHKIQNYSDVPKAAQTLLALGLKQLVLKGGHLTSDLAQDYWATEKAHFWLSTPRIACGKTHGTGCVFSASLAAFLAKGETMEDALVQAKMVLTQSLQSSLDYHGVRFAKLSRNYLQPRNVPWLTYHPLTTHDLTAFAPCHNKIGLYPIVEDAIGVAKALSWQINSLQLRIKNQSQTICEQQIKQAVAYAKQGSFQLFINDYWQLALKHQAFGVHLGQEDLNNCDIDSLKLSGLRLGISTHSFAELARALSFRPSYIAFGPIHATTTKVMRFLPQGIERLKIWRNLVNTQLVAIGGLNLSNAQAAIDCDVDGISVVSAISKATDSATACAQFMTKFKSVNPYV